MDLANSVGAVRGQKPGAEYRGNGGPKCRQIFFFFEKFGSENWKGLDYWKKNSKKKL